MKRTILIVSLVVLALGALGIGVVWAQGGQPPYSGIGPMMGDGYGWMHNYVEQVLAAKLGLTEEQVEEQLASGKTMYQIALENGIAQEDLVTFMNDVHKDAFAQAVKDGVTTQEQADWMLQHMRNMFQNGYGPDNCPVHNGQDQPSTNSNSYGPSGTMRRNVYGPGMMNGWGWQTQQSNP